MMVSNRNLLFQGSPIFRFQPFVLGGVISILEWVASVIPEKNPNTTHKSRGPQPQLDCETPQHQTLRVTIQMKSSTRVSTQK